MKILLNAAAILLVSAWMVAAGDEPSAPQGMNLRLELFVNDVEKSAEFYQRVLGFERDGGAGDYVPVRSGSVVLGLGSVRGLSKQHYFNPEVQSGRRGLGTEIVLEVPDLKAAFERVRAAGYDRGLTPMVKRPWGATDFRLVDLDGYYLRITTR